MQFLIARVSDASQVIGHTRFLHRIFSYICLNVSLADDELLHIFKISNKAITDHKNRDKKNEFTAKVFIPKEVRQFLQRNLSTHYGVAIPDAASVVVPDATG